MKSRLPYAQGLMVAVIVATIVLMYDRRDGLTMDLNQFQWKNRLLFLFAPDTNHPVFKKFQHDIAGQPHEVNDRDLVIFEILEHGASRMGSVSLDRQTADSVRNRFGISPNKFTLILVGKDGGVKLKGDDHVRLSDVFDLIDSMPMRQNEMRQKKR